MSFTITSTKVYITSQENIVKQNLYLTWISSSCKQLSKFNGSCQSNFAKKRSNLYRHHDWGILIAKGLSNHHVITKFGYCYLRSLNFNSEFLFQMVFLLLLLLFIFTQNSLFSAYCTVINEGPAIEVLIVCKAPIWATEFTLLNQTTPKESPFVRIPCGFELTSFGKFRL